MKKLYGYDKHMKSIVHGSIVRFKNKKDNLRRVGDVWEGEDWLVDDKNARCWNVSFNHTYSESSQRMEEGYDYRVIGNVDINEADEEIMSCDPCNWLNIKIIKEYNWTPIPHWND
jgi:hypothetical protein